MKIETSNIMSITEANQNFSKLAKQVEKSGSIVILKNNKPKYVLSQYKEKEQLYTDDNEKILEVALNILAKYKRAFEELSK